jgi:DNA-binding Lrp family transcriptional regulator
MDSLIRILKQNSAIPRADLARQLGLSEAELTAKIAKLEADGTILGYHAVINREVWDTGTVTAVIEVRVTPEREGGFDRIANRIAGFEEVESVYLMSGGHDLMVVVEGSNLREVAAFVADKLSTIEAVQSCATHFRLKTYKENGMFHAVEEAHERLSVTP